MTRRTSSRSSSGTTACRGSARRLRSSTTASRRQRRSPTSRSTRPPRRRSLRSRRSRHASRGGERRPRGARRRSPRSAGKLVGLPVRRLLGLPRTGPPTSWTVWLGDPDDMARRAERAAARFQRLKLKLGGRDGLDVDRVRAVRGVTEAAPGRRQRGLVARRGARGAAAARGARCRLLRAAARRPRRRRHDAEALADPDLRRRGLPPAGRRRRLCRIAHGINIKLAKSGGIREAVRMAHAARALGLGVMLGCMVESGLGSPPAASSLRSATTSISTATSSSRRTLARCGARRRSAGALRPARPVSERLLILAEGFSGDPTTGRRRGACSRTASGPSSRCSTRRASGSSRTAS